MVSSSSQDGGVAGVDPKNLDTRGAASDTVSRVRAPLGRAKKTREDARGCLWRCLVRAVSSCLSLRAVGKRASSRLFEKPESVYVVSEASWTEATESRSVSPGENFYRFANGGWLAARTPASLESFRFGIGANTTFPSRAMNADQPDPGGVPSLEHAAPPASPLGESETSPSRVRERPRESSLASSRGERERESDWIQ